MSDPVWIPTPPTARQRAVALAAAMLVASGTGALTFWLARTLLGRERLAVRPPPTIPEGEGPGRSP